MARARRCCWQSYDYLYVLLERQRLTGRQAQWQVEEMAPWLWNTVGRDNYEWSSHCVQVPMDQTWDVSVPNGGAKREFSSRIFFRHEADLLAFKLRWGV